MDVSFITAGALGNAENQDFASPQLIEHEENQVKSSQRSQRTKNTKANTSGI